MSALKANVGWATVNRHSKKEEVALIWEGNFWSDDDVHDCGDVDWDSVDIVVRKVATLLLKCCSKDDKIVVFLPKVIQLPIVAVAALRSGVVPIFLDPLQISREQLCQVLDEVCPKVLVTVDGFWQGHKLFDVLSVVNNAMSDCKDKVTTKVLWVRHVAPNSGVPPPEKNIPGRRPSYLLKVQNQLEDFNNRGSWIQPALNELHIEWSEEIMQYNDDVQPDVYSTSPDDVVALFVEFSYFGGLLKMVPVTNEGLQRLIHRRRRIFLAYDHDVDDDRNVLVLGTPTTPETLADLLCPWFFGKTLCMFEGPLDYPDTSRLAQIIVKHKIDTFFCADMMSGKLSADYLSWFDTTSLGNVFYHASDSAFWTSVFPKATFHHD